MARLVFPSRLELKRPEGSGSEAPLAKVIFTLSLYTSPVQIKPSCDHTGTPGEVGFTHLHSSTTSGSARLIKVRIRESVRPLQSPSSGLVGAAARARLVCAGARSRSPHLRQSSPSVASQTLRRERPSFPEYS